MWESESEPYGGCGGGRDYGGSVPAAHDGVQTDGFIRRDQSWHVSSDVPSDLLVRIGDANFHLHKYPLLSRSGKMNRLIYETSREAELNRVELNDIPGGTESFELAAKFCYGIAVDLTASNISGLRCAAEYLEMTEDLEEGNLIFKTEAFLSYVVLSSWRDSIVVLKSCEGLSPWAENLQIVRRCSESIAWKACVNPRGIRWPYTGKPRRSDSPKWGSAGGDSKGSSPGGSGQLQAPEADWWFEDVSLLRIDHLVRVITAIKVKGMRFDLIGASITHYASKWLPTSDVVPPSPDTQDHRTIIESLISILPPQKDTVPCSFLLRLLRLASAAKVAAALATDLEKRVGMQLEQASVADLLIPGGGSTMYDVDLVQRLVEQFIVQEQVEAESAEKVGNIAKARVARLVDGYLTEVSRDRNLSLTKFQVLAEALPESARMCDDGLYRAVDSYLKAHPMLTEHERKRLCRVMDCQKLSIDACMHAAQNERLPLRVVVQVLFSEQIKINNAIANSTAKEAHNGHGHGHYYPPMVTRKQLLEGTPLSFQEGWAMAKKDINTLKFELESMKAKYLELQNDMDSLQRQFYKLSSSSASKTGKSGSTGWGSGWKKLGKLAKMSAIEGHDVGSGHVTSTAVVEQTRKGPRRWRNSIS